ncbi:MAG: succinate dehydrogenase [Phycisphaerae bacterium]|jgi:succinate dehydrogenase / fumarate reductase cytochrome b subunit|nr:succinate dehydrogenase [Phycisphaerae bacterium]
MSSSEAGSHPDAAANQGPQSPFDRHYHLLRRLHSLSGVVPVGAFLIPHLTTNSSIVWGTFLNASKYQGLEEGGAGVATFQHEVDFIHSLPALIFIEAFVLWIPILFHALLGMHFAQSGRPNLDRYAYQGNIRYSLQRITGYIAFLFIVMHVLSLRFGVEFGGIMPSFDPHVASSTTALHFQNGTTGLAMAGFYLLGALAIVFHFANGLWTAAITWGLTISVPAQRRWGYVCTAIGLGLGGAAVAAVVGFATLNVEKAQAVEKQLQAHAAVSAS